MSKRVGRIRMLVKLAVWATLLGAIKQELDKPESEREWHGMVAGFIPYDFRAPTPQKVKARLWDPESPKVIVPQVWGVGWTLNLGRLFRLLRAALAERTQG